MPVKREVRSFCPNCLGFGGTILRIGEGRIRKARGDPDDPLSRGYILTQRDAKNRICTMVGAG